MKKIQAILFPFYKSKELTRIFKKLEKDQPKNKNIVGLDPGKKFMAYMMDEDGKKLKYSASQRKIESMAKRNNRILLTEKKKNKVIDKETKLSEQNSKTIDYKKFKKYLKDKNKLNDKLKNFYQKDVWRKMKWRQFVYSKKSEDKFLNKFLYQK